MERLRETLNLTAVFLLAIANLAALSSCQNLSTFATTIDIGSTGSADQHTNYSWSQPPNTTISIFQETTTYLPVPTTDQTQEILDSAETGFPYRYREPSRLDEEEEEDNSEKPADHVIPYSVHEDARDVPTRPEYVAPGLWAKPPPDKDIPLDFVPTKLHAQVRGTHTVKRLPQQEAIENAETDEEKHNAHRLREIVTNSKVNTVYTEEGYEDSAYDHAGHVRDADFHEGFARKLHDRKNDKQSSQSGKRKKGEHGKLVPDEYKEYDEDYQDHLEENRKREKTSDDEHNLIGYGKNAWEKSEIEPKLVVANGVQELEEDIEEDAEEAERSEKVYQRQQESRPSYEVDSSESEETHDEGDLRNEENKSVKSKKQKSKSLKEKTDILGKGTKTLRKSGQKERLREESHEKIVPPAEGSDSLEIDSETSASPHGFVTNSLNLEVTRYVTPTSFQQLDEPTTINYSQVLWDYFKTSQQPLPIALIPNSTTPNPRLEEHTPVAVATIDGHGPYLLVTKEETSTLPSTFFSTNSFQPQRLFSDPVNFASNSVGEQDRLPERSDEVSYIGGVNILLFDDPA
ncbi:myosin-M heavy chain-like [Odontomachus brunneus]|uniref:myosin-M heavy chain-like n=1 Tax=Odontomachus brunneus TaxID=486640 RepID=UPI0013F2A7E2|nr:myosin-M heavy chain-like [Odontomachus brunneus]